MTNRNFFSELKRRNVYKVAVAYVVVSWLLIQAGSVLFPIFEAPTWVLKIFVAVLALGFLPALFFAWAFEITPEGIKRESEVGADISITHHTGRKIVGITMVLAVLAAGLLAFQLLRTKERSHLEGAAPATPDQSLAKARPSISEKSIAVLPFENLSSDKENAYFAEGIQDEILTRLSKIAALKVISRTSTQKYKSAPDNLREIGQQLGVANLLEGSVQKAGKAVHINVQLIKAATDEHLWAESYDRELQNIFGVEGEVAGAIADQLKAKLSGAEKKELAVRPTRNPDAYDAYLRGLAFESDVQDFRASVLNSIKSFEDAVRFDPEFAVAWAHLCREDGLIFVNNVDQSPQRREATRKALDMAIKFGPDLIETQLATGFYKYFIERDYEGAKTQFEAIRRQYPNNAEAPHFLGGVARRQGQWEQSRLLYAQAIELDPQNIFLLTDASLTDLDSRDAVAAQKHLGRARDLSPQNGTVISLLAQSFQLTGDVAQAQTLLDTVHPNRGDGVYVPIAVANAIFLRKYDSAIAMLNTQLEDPGALGSYFGSFENLLGDLERHAGNVAKAAAAYQKSKQALNEMLPTQPDNSDFLIQRAWAETWLGDKDAAFADAQRAIIALPASKDANAGPTYEESFARIEAQFGEKDKAIAGLQHLLDIPYGGTPVVTPALLRIDPDWDNLRGDPRFEKLCQEKSK